MGRATIPVDFRNPGQVFACMGFLEAADILCGPAEGGFAWDGPERFILEAEGAENPIEAVLEFLADAEIEWISPHPDLKERDGGDTAFFHNISKSKDPKSPDLPGRLVGYYGNTRYALPFGYWSDGSHRFHTTFKKSNNGASSHIRTCNALRAIKTLDIQEVSKNPLNAWAKTSSLFRWDPRGSVDPIHFGSSPDKLRKGGIEIRVATYPICEMLAILGLENARPKIDSPYLLSYNVFSSPSISNGKQCIVLLSPMLARVAICGALNFLITRRFFVVHDEVKKGGDRNINAVFEE